MYKGLYIITPVFQFEYLKEMGNSYEGPTYSKYFYEGPTFFLG